MSILSAFFATIYSVCGRFSLLAHQELPRECFNIDRSDHVPDKLYNIDAEQEIAVIIREDDGTRIMKSTHWGLIPFWADDLDEAEYTLINIRAETIAEKHMFARAFKEQRCLVPASVFPNGRVRQVPRHRSTSI